MPIDPEAIRRKLEQLKRLDRGLKIFGAKGHHHELNPPLSDREVAAFEKNHRIRLPDDYRTFLIRVGNGGAGPYYGVFRMGEQDDGWSYAPWSKGGLVGDPSRPFVHRDAWNLPPGFFDQEPDYDEMDEKAADAAHEEWNKRLEREYWAPAIMDGAIPICHLGCAERQWLVVSGPEAGSVWQDNRADEGGIWPLTGPGRRVTFEAWYVQWLDESLATAAGKRA